MANKINYSVNEKGILAVLKANEGKSMTLAQINAVNGTDYKTGSLTSLVNKGNIEKGEMVAPTMVIVCPHCNGTHEVAVKGKQVNTYKYLADIVEA